MKRYSPWAPWKIAATLGLCAATCLTLLAPTSAEAQTGAKTASGYPAKPIRMIVPFPPGGATDILARSVAERLSARLAQTVIIDNKPGAGANIGAEAAAKSAPDGYTILMGSVASHSIALSYYRKLGYDIRRDFAPISMAGYITNVLVVTPGLPVNSVKELIALAKAKPGALSWGAAGTNGTSNMYAEWFRHTLGIDFYNLPYKNNVQTLAATASGEVQGTLFALGDASGQARAGKVKILAAISEQRLAAMPNLPTIREEGVDLVIRNWVGTFARAGTPRDIVERWNRSLSKIVLDKGYGQKVLEPQGFEAAPPSGESIESFAQFLVRDKALYVRIKNEAKLKTGE